jgi:hypothetical protein
VILGAGYSEAASQSILSEWFKRYLEDEPAFLRMLEQYETSNFDPCEDEREVPRG